jgi:hypothetical protein
MYLRQSSNGNFFNKTVLLGNENSLNLAIDKLITAKSDDVNSQQSSK